MGRDRLMPRLLLATCAFCLGLLSISFAAVDRSGAAKAPPSVLVNGYCPPSGVYCTWIIRQHHRFKFEINADFRGRYRLCVDPPSHPTECIGRRLRYGFGGWEGKVDFQRHFFHRAPGRYAVSWRRHGSLLGRVVFFRPHKAARTVRRGRFNGWSIAPGFAPITALRAVSIGPVPPRFGFRRGEGFVRWEERRDGQ